MPILNYTTTIPAEKTIAQIQSLLIKNGAKSIRVDYEQGQPTTIEFETNTATLGRQYYRYSPNVNGVLETMKSDKKVPRSQCNPMQARRVAWRIEKDWLEAQFAKIESMRLPLEKIMLPYTVSDNGQTIYELMVNQYKALPASSGVEITDV